MDCRRRKRAANRSEPPRRASVHVTPVRRPAMESGFPICSGISRCSARNSNRWSTCTSGCSPTLRLISRRNWPDIATTPTGYDRWCRTRSRSCTVPSARASPSWSRAPTPPCWILTSEPTRT
uniref:(northern house mosquito) hypothetical protein n=1 Tax=Culex pipiens TaxID=7175 RepID=A0A8D8NDW1_CULPI